MHKLTTILRSGLFLRIYSFFLIFFYIDSLMEELMESNDTDKVNQISC